MSSLSEYYEKFHLARKKAGTAFIPERAPFFARHVGNNKDVIELGCRYGHVLAPFSATNRVIGVDVDRHALAHCEREFGIKTLVVDLNHELPFANESFDVVLISEVLEHLPYPSMTLQEARRILRPGGIILGSVPNATRLRNRIRFLITGIADPDPTHLQLFSQSSFQLLLGAHFQDSKVHLVTGRFLWISRRLFAHHLFFVATKP